MLRQASLEFRRVRLRKPLRAAACAAICLCLAPAARSQPPAIDPLIARQLRACDVQVVHGRLQMASPPGQRSVESTIAGVGRAERLSIAVNNGLTDLSFEAESADGRLTLTVQASESFTLRYEPTGEKAPSAFEFSQPARGELTLTVGPGEARRETPGEARRETPGEARRETPGEARRETKAASLWELLLVEPTAARQNLLPLLKAIFPRWEGTAELDAIAKAVVQMAGRPRTAPGKAWGAWVKQLAAKSFADREAAQQRLLAAGSAVVPYLQSLDGKTLDAEQRFRVRSILRQLTAAEGADEPAKIAATLVDNRRVWLGLLSSEELSWRKAAVGELARLSGSPIDFDAAAPEPVRAAQLQALRELARDAPDETPDR